MITFICGCSTKGTFAFLTSETVKKSSELKTCESSMPLLQISMTVPLYRKLKLKGTVIKNFSLQF